MRLTAIVALILLGTSAVAADEAALWAALKAGGHVALVRHAATTGGAGDPPDSGWKTVPVSAT